MKLQCKYSKSSSSKQKCISLIKNLRLGVSHFFSVLAILSCIFLLNYNMKKATQKNDAFSSERLTPYCFLFNHIAVRLLC